MKHMLLIALGGAGGALARHWLSSVMSASSANHFPIGTLSVNVLGSFLIGVMYVIIVEKGLIHPDWRSVFIIGFLGAFTTFSTFSLEAVTLLENGHAAMAAGYVLLSVATCLLGVWLSMVLTRFIW
ncbi:fluoride efflux transporter CrcB [Halieaceae bacterium IMCC14734]|uniref:Fluoride-specific ion channel FluC n=1 Tax=Candidatus Litorirhabdus singularis TaxID=2518993 RepID=A0ABT3TGW2_9GAMM|nr:fluoride efflux transporter CrcB [Candidatus Litorirhabdus singularis]MCX2981244.1 fluoride efflux transporter CrcB [Candidatus Litorirhabdus singularis]